MSFNEMYYANEVPSAFDIFNINDSFVEYVNKYREDISGMCKNILAQTNIMTYDNFDVEFDFTNVKCQLGNDEYKLKLERYLRESIMIKDTANPLSYDAKLNARFNDRIAPYLFDELLFGNINNKTSEVYFNERVDNDLLNLIPSDVYTFILVTDVEVYNVESQIQMLIIDDFLRICGKTDNQKNERTKIHVKHRGPFKKDKVCMLNKKYTTIFTSFVEKHQPRPKSHRKFISEGDRDAIDSNDEVESIRPKKLRVGSENVDFNPTNSFYGDVLIMLVNTDIETKKIPLDSGFYTMLRNQSSRSNIKVNSMYSINRKESRKEEDFVLKAQKYQNLIDTPKVVDFDSIKYQFDKVDMDGDGFISQQDLQNFIKKHNIDMPLEDTECMIQKANYRKKKAINYNTNMSLYEPITVKDLVIETKFKLKIIKGVKQFVYPEFYENWMILMKLLGIGTTVKKLDTLRTKPIRTNYEHHKDAVLRKTQSHVAFRRTAATTTSDFYKTQSTISDVPKKCFAKKSKPEGGILLNNTKYLQEVRNFDTSAPFKIDPIEKVVNNKFVPANSKRPSETIKFNTKKYYNEGVRISQYPPLVKGGSLHPIYRYTPAAINTDKGNKEKMRDQPFETQQSESRMTIPSVVFGRRIDSLLNFDKQSSEEEFEGIPKETSLHSIDPSNEGKILDESERPEWWDAKLPEYIEESETNRKKPIFRRHFKETTIDIVNRKLAYQQHREKKINALEPADTYQTDKVHKFREEVISQSKPHFMNRIHSESGLLPMFSAINEPMPREAMEKMKREQIKAKLLDDDPEKKQLFHTKFHLADRLHMLGENKAFPFLEKGMFDEDILNQVDMGHADLSNKDSFKVFFRTKYCKDRADLVEEI